MLCGKTIFGTLTKTIDGVIDISHVRDTFLSGNLGKDTSDALTVEFEETL